MSTAGIRLLPRDPDARCTQRRAALHVILNTAFGLGGIKQKAGGKGKRAFIYTYAAVMTLVHVYPQAMVSAYTKWKEAQ